MMRSLLGRVLKAVTPNVCSACGKTFDHDDTICPFCFTPVGGIALQPPQEGSSTPSLTPIAVAPRQMVKVYKGNHPEKEFQRDATKLEKLGWRVANQSQGGVNTWQIGRKHPTNITVTYIRD